MGTAGASHARALDACHSRCGWLPACCTRNACRLPHLQCSKPGPPPTHPLNLRAFLLQAVGMLFRCEGCPSAYCEDHLPQEADITQICARFAALGVGRLSGACYVRCSPGCATLAEALEAGGTGKKGRRQPRVAVSPAAAVKKGQERAAEEAALKKKQEAASRRRSKKAAAAAVKREAAR